MYYVCTFINQSCDRMSLSRNSTSTFITSLFDCVLHGSGPSCTAGEAGGDMIRGPWQLQEDEWIIVVECLSLQR